MLNPPTLQATPSAISLLASASGAMRYVNQDGLTVDLFGRVVARANPLAQQATGGGVTDKRHLWPTWFNLIRECRPPVIFGEQVESAVNHGWLDLVQADLEREDYACGAVGLPAGGVGAPHIRQRLWFVADSQHDGRWSDQQRRQAQGRTVDGRLSGLAESLHHGNVRIIGDSIGKKSQNQSGGARIRVDETGNNRATCQLADADSGRHDGWASATGQQAGASAGLANGSAPDQLADANGTRSAAWVSESNDGEKRDAGISDNSSGQKFSARFRPENFWSDCDWLPCRDGKARPVEPGTFPLAHGTTARVGRLRAYGNAIVPQVAQTFIEAYLES